MKTLLRAVIVGAVASLTMSMVSPPAASAAGCWGCDYYGGMASFCTDGYTRGSGGCTERWSYVDFMGEWMVLCGTSSSDCGSTRIITLGPDGATSGGLGTSDTSGWAELAPGEWVQRGCRNQIVGRAVVAERAADVRAATEVLTF
jgi:hypothetical protein